MQVYYLRMILQSPNMHILLLTIFVMLRYTPIQMNEGPMPFDAFGQADKETLISDTAMLARMIGEAKMLYGKKENIRAMAVIRDAMKFAETKKIAIPYTLYRIYAETALAMGDYGTA